MANADKCHLDIPFKEHLKGVQLDADGKVDATSLRVAADQEFENYKVIERRINNPACGSGECECSAFWIVGSFFADGTESISVTAGYSASKSFDLSDANATYEYNQTGWNADGSPDTLTTANPGSALYVVGGFAELVQLSGSSVVGVELDVSAGNGAGVSSTVYPPTSGAYPFKVSASIMGEVVNPVEMFMGVSITGPFAASLTRAFTLTGFYMWGHSVCGCPNTAGVG